MSGRSNAIAGVLRQDAVYWGSPTPDGTGGRTFAAAVQIKCRWEDGSFVFTNAEGREEVATSQVFVASDLDLEGYLYLGGLTWLSAAQRSNPLIAPGAVEIRGRSKDPDVSGTRFLREVWVKA
jgi:hypothetical protein